MPAYDREDDPRLDRLDPEQGAGSLITYIAAAVALSFAVHPTSVRAEQTQEQTQETTASDGAAQSAPWPADMETDDTEDDTEADWSTTILADEPAEDALDDVEPAPAVTEIGPEFRGEVAEAPRGAPSVLVVIGATDPDDETTAIDLQRILTLRLLRHPALRAYEPTPELMDDPGWDPDRRLEQARAHADEGLTDYLAGDFDRAAEAFQDALHRYAQAIPSGFDMTEMAEPFLLLGASLLRTGNEHEAQEAFRGAAIMDPDLEADRARFSASVQRAFAKTREEVTTRKTGQVTVVTEPPHAEVWINGVYSGFSPVAIEDIPVGPAYVLTARRGYATRVDRPITLSGEDLSLDLRMREGPQTPVYHRLVREALAVPDSESVEIPEAVARLGDMFPLHRVVVGRVGEDEMGRHVRLTAYDLFVGERMIDTRLDLQALSAEELVKQADDLLRKIDAPLPAVHPSAAKELPEEITDPGRWPLGLTPRDWRFWAATGAGAALLATGVVLVATSAANDDARQPPSSWPVVRIP